MKEEQNKNEEGTGAMGIILFIAGLITLVLSLTVLL